MVRAKKSLETRIEDLDRTADTLGLLEAGWSLRYNVEAALMQLHQQAETYWRQRGTLNWTLKGDSPTAYFFAIAYGRRRRCYINNLLINGVRSSDQSLILSHVVEFFSSLLGAKQEGGLSISPFLWDNCNMISNTENEALMNPLSDEDLGGH